MVFYRKYRPQKVEELDSKKVRETLSSVLSKGQKGELAHAFLFTGPKGLGKTSAARIVAKAVNCVGKRESFEPCNKCEQCISITRGTNLDVLEIDGASNRGIDEVRDLREKIRLSPASSKKKVYIIDEVHMLTTEAFNALLKTLEEPPPHAMFILCTTEPQKLPPTIISRCFHVAFTKAKEEELVRSLTRIVKKEKLDVEKDALGKIAHLSDGSFRDASKILEELVLSSGKKRVTAKFLEETYYISNIDQKARELLISIKNKDVKKSLEAVSNLTEQGVEQKFLIEKLVLELHSELLKKAGLLEGESNFEFSEIRTLSNLLNKAYVGLKDSVISSMPLEVAIVEYSEAGNDGGFFADSGGARQEFSGAQGDPRLLTERRPSKSSSGTKNSKTSFNSPSSNKNSTLLEELIEKVKGENHMVAGILRGVKLKELNGKRIVFETASKFHKERLEERKTMELIEREASEISGKNINISVILKN